MKKLLGLGDIRVMTINNHCSGKWIPPVEMNQVLKLISDVTYVLYSVYRTYPFEDSTEIHDTAVGKLLGWDKRKVQDHRLLLEKANLFRMVRYGTKTDGITKVFVGMDSVALFDAGLPCDILSPKALNKLKKEFNIKSPEELVNNAVTLVATFEQNPNDYL